MSCNLKKCINKLLVISKVKNLSLRKKLLKDISCDEKVFAALQEIALNTVHSNVPLETPVKKKLRKYKKDILKLTKKVKSKRKQKSLVVQSGGFLPFLIPAVLSVLTSVLSNNSKE